MRFEPQTLIVIFSIDYLFQFYLFSKWKITTSYVNYDSYYVVIKVLNGVDYIFRG